MRPFALLLLLAASLSGAEIATIAGDGISGLSATRINNPYGLVIGPDGALYFCEIGNHVVRRLDLTTHALTVVAGSGQKGYKGDGGPATEALLNEPYELRFDADGNLFFAEMQNHVVRRVDARTKVISTIAGIGSPGFSGDGGPATKAQFRQPHSIAFDPQGNLLVCDIGNLRIRKIDLSTGMISTWAGTGAKENTPDGAPREGTPLNGPRAIDFDRQGNLYLALREGNAILRLDAREQKFRRIAGTGEKGYAGDGGPAREAKLSGPKGLSYSADGGLYLADTESHTIRRVDLKTGKISTVVGTGERGDGPDGDPLKCKLSRPHGVFAAQDGSVYIADSESHRIRLWRKN